MFELNFIDYHIIKQSPNKKDKKILIQVFDRFNVNYSKDFLKKCFDMLYDNNDSYFIIVYICTNDDIYPIGLLGMYTKLDINSLITVRNGSLIANLLKAEDLYKFNVNYISILKILENYQNIDYKVEDVLKKISDLLITFIKNKANLLLISNDNSLISGNNLENFTKFESIFYKVYNSNMDTPIREIEANNMEDVIPNTNEEAAHEVAEPTNEETAKDATDPPNIEFDTITSYDELKTHIDIDDLIKNNLEIIQNNPNLLGVINHKKFIMEPFKIVSIDHSKKIYNLLSQNNKRLVIKAPSLDNWECEFEKDDNVNIIGSDERYVIKNIVKDLIENSYLCTLNDDTVVQDIFLEEVLV